MEAINQATTALKETIWGEETATNNNHNNNNASTSTGGANGFETYKSMIDDKIIERRSNGRPERDPDAEYTYQSGQDYGTNRQPQGPISTSGQPRSADVTGYERDTNKNTFGSSNEPNTSFSGSPSAHPSAGAHTASYPAQRDSLNDQGSNKRATDPDVLSNTSGNSNNTFGSSGGLAGSGAAGGLGGMKLPESDNQSKGEGTGTKYEKSTGLAAEGGDFDATRPGAAREAARLMDEKGIAHGDSKGESGEPKKEKKWYGVDHSGFGGHGSHQNKRPSISDPQNPAETLNNNRTDVGSTDDDYSHTEKKGLSQKIKEKLHRTSD
ncbi:hypothetical protein TWF718_004321 [Orbilia javanica]|uniref:Uncharacterized protein n=1 Tax=Orbilia javanica TaxID=47235 RepID=A0AAN8NB97_9PEZI